MERWKTIAWFVFTILAILSLVPPGDDTNEANRPTSENTRAPGLAALTRWLRTADIPVHSQRLRLEDVASVASTPTGNILVLHLPTQLIYEGEEIAAAMNWVAAGNTLLVASGHLEGTPWIYQGLDPSRSLWRLTGLGLVWGQPSDALRVADENANSDDDSDDEQGVTSTSTLETSTAQIEESLNEALDTPGWLLLHGARTSVALAPLIDHPINHEMYNIEVPWDGNHWSLEGDVMEVINNAGDQEVEKPERPWQTDIDACQSVAESIETQSSFRHLSGRSGCLPIASAEPTSWQTLLKHADTSQPVLLNAPVNQGQVFVLLHPSLLDNEVMHRFNNRRFVQNLVSMHLAPGGTVIIDDAHQGLNDIIEGEDLLSDSRFYASIGFLLLFWLAYLLADSGQWARAIHKTQPQFIRQFDLVLGSANFLRKRLHPSATTEAIVQPLVERLAGKWGLPKDQALTQGLTLESERHPQAVERLRRLLEQSDRGKRVSLPELQRSVLEVIHA